MKLIYMSFADPTKPKGTQWLGGAYIEVPDDESFRDTIGRGHREGWNPGGEIMSFDIPWDKRIELKDSHVNVLLNLDGLKTSIKPEYATDETGVVEDLNGNVL